MRKIGTALALAAALPVLAIVLPAHAQPPETVLIQGQLLDDQGAPIVGLRQYRVRFFDAEVDGAQLGGDITDVTQVNTEGLFAIALIPPSEVLSAPDAWYELALDSGMPPVGIGPEDVFPERVRVHSVPFARVAGEALSIEVDAIAGGAVSAAEFESLAGITGSVQSQLDIKANASAVDDALALKADAAALETVEVTLADKADLAEVLPRAGAAFVVVETTDDPAQNAANLLIAYAEAASLEPHGQALDAENRVMVIVPPGKYDLGSGQLVMDTEFVDLVGSTTARDNHHIFGTSAGPGTGVLRQTANNVRIENLFVECTRDMGVLDNDASDPAAYFPNDNLPDTVIRNSRFFANDVSARSMRVAIEYSGNYEDVAGGSRIFGGEGGIASGTFINCTGGFRAFAGGDGLASGAFVNCHGTTGAFGGQGGEASGSFTNCTGGNSAFGGGSGGVASGTFTHCAGGPWSFGGQGDASGGEFYYCVGGLGAITDTGSPAPVRLYCVRNGVAIP